jgi:hypothetical protein
VFNVNRNKGLISYNKGTSDQSGPQTTCRFDLLLLSMFVYGYRTGLLKQDIPEHIDHETIHLKVNNASIPFSIALLVRKDINFVEMPFESLKMIWIDILAKRIDFNGIDNSILLWIIDSCDFKHIGNNEEINIYRTTLMEYVYNKIKEEFAKVDKEQTSAKFCTFTITAEEIDKLFFSDRSLFFALYDEMFAGIKSYLTYKIYTNKISVSDCITITAERN